MEGSHKYCWSMVLVKRRPPEYGAVSQIQVCFTSNFRFVFRIDVETPGSALFSVPYIV